MKNKYIMSGTTSIDQLPVNPQTNTSNSPPVQLAVANAPLPQSLGESQNVKIDNYGQQLNQERGADNMFNPVDYTSDLSTALKAASASGATVLPSRDIPQNTLTIQQDDNVKPNFVPKNKSDDYIGDILDKERIIKENSKNQNHSDNMDYIYQQIQLPILVGIIYFLFQLPVFRKQLLSFLPNLFQKDGNPKLSGYIFNSIMFASLYALLIKLIAYLNN